MKKVLTITGSDSGGACGIQADIKTFSALGVYRASVITAVTAQNSIQSEGYEESEVVYVRSPQAQHSGWQGKGNRVPILLVQVHCLCTLV